MRSGAATVVTLNENTKAYIGSRATGNEAGAYLIAGPRWKGKAPPGIPGQKGIKKVFHCETDFCLIGFRTQLFGPADIDVAQLYDAFSPLIPLSLEGYGFCARGEGAAFTENGNLEFYRGSLPTNTSGAGMSEAYVHGFNLIVEGVRQLRGESHSQVPDAETSIVTSGEGVPTSAILLRR